MLCNIPAERRSHLSILFARQQQSIINDFISHDDAILMFGLFLDVGPVWMLIVLLPFRKNTLAAFSA